MAGWKSFTIFPLFFCLTFLVVGILTIWYSCSLHPNWKTSSFRNLHFCWTMNPFSAPHPGWPGSQCFPASPLLHTAYQPFQKGQLLSHVAVGSMFLSKHIAGWFSKLIWVISGIVFTATFFSWETGGADQSSESLQRRILPDRWPWQFVFDIGPYISINSSWRRKAKEQSMAWSWWTTTRNSTGSTPGWWASRAQILNWTLSLGHVVSSRETSIA